MVILCGSIPTLQPLWERFITHELNAKWERISNNKSYPSSDGSKETGPGSNKQASYYSNATVASRSTSEMNVELGNQIVAKTETVLTTEHQGA